MTAHSNPTLPVFRLDATGLCTGEFTSAPPRSTGLWQRLLNGLDPWLHPAPACCEVDHPDLCRDGARILWRGRPYSGALIERADDGQLLARYRVRGGWLHGRCLRWHADGSPRSEFRYRRGYCRGLQKIYRHDGSFRANWVDRRGNRWPT